MAMQTVDHFINEAIGRPVFAKETGYSPQVISRAIADNLMPAGWYRDVRDLCRRLGKPCPDHLFRWVDKRRPLISPPEGAEATAEGPAARSGAAPVETHGVAPASAQEAAE